ncbi:hypothetical protein [Xanthomonas vasicola]|uniref:hypothetical protein n=1 Tax=Xanthomonas vasicola TaxID=56459 RepID=UPI0012D36318|nr:hypothetical protein [Xanthomonas vasicola]
MLVQPGLSRNVADLWIWLATGNEKDHAQPRWITAAQAEQAQAAQRAAVQARLAQGGTASHTLGAPLSDAARSWIAQQTGSAADALPMRCRCDADAMPMPMPMASGASEAAGSSDIASVSGSISASRSVGSSTAPPLSSHAISDGSSNQAASSFAASCASVSDTSKASDTDNASYAFIASDASVAASTFASGSKPASAASTPSAALAKSNVCTAPARRSARRHRWMPPLALAASVTLAVGVCLQWQASRPVPDASAPAAGVSATTESEKNVRAALWKTEQIAPQNAASGGLGSDLPPRPPTNPLPQSRWQGNQHLHCRNWRQPPCRPKSAHHYLHVW